MFWRRVTASTRALVRFVTGKPTPGVSDGQDAEG
jgi:hypothetical protein